MLIMIKLDNEWFGVVNLAENTISDEMIRDEIYRRFLEPTKKDKKEYIGIEIEIPIINLICSSVSTYSFEWGLLSKSNSPFINENTVFIGTSFQSLKSKAFVETRMLLSPSK